MSKKIIKSSGIKHVKYEAFKVGGVDTFQGGVEPNPEELSRLALMLWGPSGAGKTSWSATAPGHKLWLSMGDNEHVPVRHRSDVTIADISGLSIEELFRQGMSTSPFGLDQVLANQTHIETVVFDSATALTFRALQKAVDDGVGQSHTFKPSMLAPGISAYGGRNAVVIVVMTELLRITAKYNVHFIVTGHEDDPTIRKGTTDTVEHIAIMLGGKIANNMTHRLSEIWHMRQLETGEKHRIVSVRPTDLRKPMKSRMFTYSGKPSFVLDYDAEKPDAGQMTIASIHEAWVKNGYRKVPLPQGRVR